MLRSVPIRTERPAEHLLLVTIDRPERKNSLDLHHFRDLAAAWKDFGADDDLWVAIVTGTEGCFMSGADLKDYVPQITALADEIARGEVEEIDGCRLSDGTDAVLRNSKVYKPIIAAIDGPCVAGGMEMLGGCDIRVASERSTFGVMEPKRGLFAGGGTTARLPRQIPYAAAMELLLCADAVSAQRALALGLLNEVVAPEEVLPRAMGYAERILANGPLAVRATKESVVRGMTGTLRDHYRIEADLSQVVFASDDAKEGPLAFAEKRAPRWQNR
jgi:enoyl-CoA hydratase